MQTTRIQSIDVFRGLTILIMIFVNDLAGISQIPAWLHHAPEGSPGMTFVDIVYPAFLFIVGLSIPFAVAQRKKKFPHKSIWLHLSVRTIGLLVIGLLMLNGPAVSSMNTALWNILMYSAAILFWTAYPQGDAHTVLHDILKWLGFIILLFLVISYRRNGVNGEIWIKTSWWGILGEIGFAYFIASVVYILFKSKPAIIYSAPVLGIFLYMADRSGQLNFLGSFKDIFYIGSHWGIHPMIAISGMICGKWIFDKNTTLLKNMGIFAGCLLISAYLLYGLYGIDKIAATPSWAMISTAVCILIFMIIYYFMDVKKHSGCYSFFKPIASNPLLAYLLHVLFIYIFMFTGFIYFYGNQLGSGMLGIVRSLAYTFFIYAVSRWLTGLGVRLKL